MNNPRKTVFYAYARNKTKLDEMNAIMLLFAIEKGLDITDALYFEDIFYEGRSGFDQIINRIQEIGFLVVPNYAHIDLNINLFLSYKELLAEHGVQIICVDETNKHV